MNQTLYFSIFMLITTNLFGQTPSYIKPAKLTLYKSYHVKADSEYSLSSARYDYEGSELERNEGAVYTKLDTNLELSYGIGRRFEVALGGRFRQLYSLSSENADEQTAVGVESYWGSMRYAFRPMSNWQYTLGLKYRGTAYSNNTIDANSADSEIDLGDAGTEMTASVYIDYYRTKGHYLTSYLGYNMPANNLSPELVYKAESVWVNNSWSYLVGVKGISSMNADSISEDGTSTREAINTGYTSQFNTINRSYVHPYLGVNFKIGSFLVGLKYGQSLYEISNDKISQYTISLDYNSSAKSYVQSKKLSSFKEYILEASIIKISPRGKFLKIDKGSADEVQMGRKFDVYQTDFFGGNKLLAAGVVVETSSDWAIIKLIKRYRIITIKKGYTVRGY